jgi:hypothetical protein
MKPPKLPAMMLGTVLLAGTLTNNGETLSNTHSQEVTAVSPQTSEAMALLATHASVNIIYVHANNAQTTPSDEFDPIYNKFAIDLKGDSQDFRKRVLEDIATTSRGRYAPRDMSVVLAGTINLEGACINSQDNGQEVEIRKIAAPLLEPGKLNTIFVDGKGCDDMAAFNKFESATPVLTLSSLTSVGPNIMHELAHGAGLGHAGVAHCDQPVRIDACTVEPAADPGSVMSYNYKRAPLINLDDGSVGPSHLQFTTPELGQLGMLNSSEQLSNPEDGTYTLGDDFKNSKSLKLVRLDTDQGPIAISWERDNTIGHSLQLRSTTAEGVYSGYNLVPMPTQNIPWLNDSKTFMGEVNAGSDIYKDSSVEVVFEGMNSQGSAQVSIKHSTRP